MKSEKIYDAITEIKDEFIEQAGEYNFGKRYHRQRIIRWGSMAACAAILLLGGLGISNIRFGYMGSSNGSMASDRNRTESSTTGAGESDREDVLQVLAYNGSLYNLSNSIEVLNRAGIENIMTEDSCGKLLGNLRKTEFGYEPTAMETDIEIYEYVAATSNEAVMVIRDGEDYMAGLFSNYRGFNETAFAELVQLYKTYGITEAEDLVMVAERESVDADFSNVYGIEVTDRMAVEEFYRLSLATGNDLGSAFDEHDVYGYFLPQQMTEEELERAEELLEQDERVLCIETAEGLKFYMSYYPTYGWLYSENAMAYYPVDENLKNWFETYFQMR